jgi:hypothetical protein
MQVIDNFLNEEDYTALCDGMLSNSFPWYWGWTKTRDPDKGGGDAHIHNCQLVHPYYRDHEKTGKHWYLIEPIVNKLEASAFIRIKANLTMATPHIIETYMHHDYSSNMEHNIAIYYLNDNDGYTKFESTGEIIRSVGNRILIFDGREKHCGTTHTNQKFRCVINFNYFPTVY